MGVSLGCCPTDRRPGLDARAPLPLVSSATQEIKIK